MKEQERHHSATEEISELRNDEVKKVFDVTFAPVPLL